MKNDAYLLIKSNRRLKNSEKNESVYDLQRSIVRLVELIGCLSLFISETLTCIFL